ncbi:MAG: PDZ domain-containing protein [Duodenibacillus sp.]|nr:PDZ domain-containing protein [Duodenibacillus sp.]
MKRLFVTLACLYASLATAGIESCWPCHVLDDRGMFLRCIEECTKDGVKEPKKENEVMFDVGVKRDGSLEIVVRPGGVAEKAGLKTGDIITHIDGMALTTYDNWSKAIADIRPGQRVLVKVDRAGEKKVIPVTPRAMTEVDRIRRALAKRGWGVAYSNDFVHKRSQEEIYYADFIQKLHLGIAKGDDGLYLNVLGEETYKAGKRPDWKPERVGCRLRIDDNAPLTVNAEFEQGLLYLEKLSPKLTNQLVRGQRLAISIDLGRYGEYAATWDLDGIAMALKLLLNHSTPQAQTAP